MIHPFVFNMYIKSKQNTQEDNKKIHIVLFVMMFVECLVYAVVAKLFFSPKSVGALHLY